jgi:hypothetical protein
MNEQLDLFVESSQAPLWTEFVIALALCIFFSFLLKHVYRVSAHRIGLINYNSNILPVLSVTVFLVIVTVKQSLALSLGLVGALSIVRFRTPVKEPEDLIFYFIAIAIGLGFGANQILLTTAALPVLFAVILVQSFRAKKTSNGNFLLRVDTNGALNDGELLSVLSNWCRTIELKRRDSTPDRQSVAFEISLSENFAISGLVDELKLIAPEASVTFVETRGHY